MDTARLTLNLFQRAAQLIGFGLPLDEIRNRFLADGFTDDEFFLIFKAGERMVANQVTCAHGVPQILHRKMTTSFFSPDTERCEPCRIESERENAEREAETNAFIERLARRRKAREAAAGE